MVRSPSRSMATSAGRAEPSPSWVSRATRGGTHAISPAASASGWLWRQSSSRSRSCSCWTSRRVGSIRSGRTNSWSCFTRRRRAARRWWRRTISSSPRRWRTASFRPLLSGRSSLPRLAGALAVSAALAAAAWAVARPDDAALSLLLVAGAPILAGAAWPRSGPGASAGVALGPRAGASTGALAALVSNFYLGQGAYTPWQMLAWGGCGLLGGLGARLLRRRLALAVFCFVLGFGFDAVMDVWEWLSFYPHTWQAFAALYARGIWFDVAHASGNLVLALAVGPELRRLLERYARRLRAEVVWA